MVSSQYLNGPDELIEALVNRRDALRMEIGKLVGMDCRKRNDLPPEAAPEWSDEAKALHEEYWKTDAEIWRRKSRRDRMQLTWVVTELYSGEPTSSEVWRWFRSRY